MSRSHYDVLGIATDASVADVRNAYKKLALQLHPDKVESNCKSQTTQAFLLVSEAYRTLVDPFSRHQYDTVVLPQSIVKQRWEVGRISGTASLRDDFERSSESGADSSVCEFTMECRCGGSYVVMVNLGSVPTEGIVSHAECDTCSLVIAVEV